MEEFSEYDYIIIGAGTAGCVLVDALLQGKSSWSKNANQNNKSRHDGPHLFSRLVDTLSTRNLASSNVPHSKKKDSSVTNDNLRVLLLEWGPPRTQQQKPLSWANTESTDGSKTEKESLIISTDPHNWWKTAVSSIFSRQYYSEENRDCFRRNFLLARGSGAGGTSIVNAMQYSRGAPSDYLEWFDYENENQHLKENKEKTPDNGNGANSSHLYSTDIALPALQDTPYGLTEEQKKRYFR